MRTARQHTGLSVQLLHVGFMRSVLRHTPRDCYMCVIKAHNGTAACCCRCLINVVYCVRSIVLRRTRFDAREADFYEALYTQSRASFGAYVTAGTLLNNYAHIFDLVGLT